MSDIARVMTQDVLNAFVNRNAQRAADVITRNDEIDYLKVEIIRELSLMTSQDPSRVNKAMKISFVAQYLERIADHATNIAEMLIYLVKGMIIKRENLTPENKE